MFAGVQASDAADSSMHQGFLSKYMGSDASKTSLGEYNKFAMHRFNHMTHEGQFDALSHNDGLAEHGPALYDSQQVIANSRYGGISASTVFDKQAHAARAQDLMAFASARAEPQKKTKRFEPAETVDKEELKAAQKLLANDSIMPLGLSAIGVSLLTLAAMLGVRIRRGSQQATTFANCGGHESDMSVALAPTSVDGILELKMQQPSIRSFGWSQQSSKDSRPMTLCYATEAAVMEATGEPATAARPPPATPPDVRERFEWHYAMQPEAVQRAMAVPELCSEADAQLVLSSVFGADVLSLDRATAELHRDSVRSARCLDADACGRLRSRADATMARDVAADNTDGLPNFQVNLAATELREVVGPEAHDALLALPLTVFGDARIFSEVNAFVRRYCPDERSHMGFHSDGNIYTANIALSQETEYEGGRLVVLTNGGMRAVPRERGHATVHGGAVCHAVGPVTAGLRYSLILFFHE